jgi:AraC-like DNA-binding protein
MLHAAHANAPAVAAAYARLLDDYLRRAGQTALPPTLRSRIEAAGRGDPQTSISRAEWLSLLALLGELTGDENLALKIGAGFQFRHLGLAGHVLINCATLGEAGRLVVRYNRLMGDVGNSRVIVRGAQAEDIFQWPEPEPPPVALEQLWAAATATLGRWLSGRDDLAWQAHFRFAAPQDQTDYLRIFRQPPRFGARETKLVFPASVLDLPIATGNPELRALAEAQAASALRALDSEPELLRRTRQLIGQRLGSEHASLDAIAVQLGMSSRTLHRRLAEAGCNFRELVDSARRTRAEALLRAPTVALAEIAFMLGYGEQSSFQHAFKRWTGQTPGEFRADATALPLHPADAAVPAKKS